MVYHCPNRIVCNTAEGRKPDAKNKQKEKYKKEAIAGLEGLVPEVEWKLRTRMLFVSVWSACGFVCQAYT